MTDPYIYYRSLGLIIYEGMNILFPLSVILL